MNDTKMMMILAAIEEGDRCYWLYFNVNSDTEKHPEIYVFGNIRAAVIPEDLDKYEIGKRYDLDMQEVII